MEKVLAIIVKYSTIAIRACMTGKTVRQPTVLIPYTGPCERKECQDVFVYLRPETNGVEVESILLRVIHGNPDYKDRLKLVYLANIPGDFIVRNKIIEKHYRMQFYFATTGKNAFTPYMRDRFEKYFGVGFENAAIIGSFHALSLLGMTYNELFALRVPVEDMLRLHGQTIKRYKDYFIINYDLPALVHKNNNQTDIAVMIFRTNFSYDVIHDVIDEMSKALINENILHPGKPLSRVFHYSKGPFDQIRDAIGYLYTKDIDHVSFKQIAFSNYLLDRGITMQQISGLLNNPLMRFSNSRNGIVESDIFTYTADHSFSDAYKKLMQVVSQVVFT